MEGCSLAGMAGPSGGLKKRTRRGQRRRKTGPEGGHPVLVAPPPTPVSPARHVRIIGRSREVDRAEADLRRALIVTVLGHMSSDSAAIVLDALASRFSFEADALHLRRAASNSFLVFFPSEDHATRVFNGGQSLFIPPVRLHLKRWSRQALASSGSALPLLLDIELRGIPAHLWELGTAEVLLNGFCLIQELHPESVEGIDMSVLKLRAWSFNPDCLPAVLDLHVQEPLVEGEDGAIFPRSLVYPIIVKVTRSGVWPEGSLPPPPPSPPGDVDEDHDQDHQRRRLLQHGPSASSFRTSVHSRLGPRAPSSSVAGGPVDAAILPSASGEELTAPVSSSPLVSSVQMLGAPVEAATLPITSVVELAAPGPPPPCLDASPAVPPHVVEASRAVGSHAQDVPVSLDERSLVSTSLPSAGLEDHRMLASFFESRFSSEGFVPSLNGLPAAGSQLSSAGSRAVDVELGFQGDCSLEALSSIIDLPMGPAMPLACRLNAKPPCFKVYSRRKKAIVVEEQILSTPLQEFKDGLTKPTDELLPPPALIVKRRKMMPSNFKPRRSRRVAKFPPELGSDAAAKVCRHLGFCDEHENISFRDASNYARLFHSTLSRDHVAALAALFGWEVPHVEQI